MVYRDVVQSILSLPWESADPGDVIAVSHAIAKEFAAGLRRSIAMHPADSCLQEVAAGELKTNNLNYEGYAHAGDHWEFLDFFIKKVSMVPSKPVVTRAITKSLSDMNSFSVDETVMLIASREKESKKIYTRILQSQSWAALGFGFYEYYLQRHISLDSEEGGHADLLANFPIDDTVLTRGYTARLELYSSLF